MRMVFNPMFFLFRLFFSVYFFVYIHVQANTPEIRSFDDAIVMLSSANQSENTTVSIDAYMYMFCFIGSNLWRHAYTFPGVCVLQFSVSLSLNPNFLPFYPHFTLHIHKHTIFYPPAAL